ncbi:acyl-CoA dehydratase activase [Paratractidigestivibacter faecalis]|uniref:acyl-CoA dehydratase activase n=1 Tax=Paratractidigestivibacter faecalis TaxID=2292441 RepID=UPI00388FCC09
MIGIGIDIGSTAAKAAVLSLGQDAGEKPALLFTHVEPTGYSSVDASDRLSRALGKDGYDVGAGHVVATGYGRVSVPYAGKVVTEITCHGLGAGWLFGPDGTVVDVGGQDTKVIQLKGGRVGKFAMNDKCAAGTGRFLEVMADRLGVSQGQMSELAAAGVPTKISSMCTVFAESEVIGLVGRGEPKQNIARGVIESVVSRVATLASQAGGGAPFFLTGGLCENAYVVRRLGEALGSPVETCPDARYAGAIGAALKGLFLP